MANDEALFYKQRERFNALFGQYKSISYAQTFPTLREALSQWEFTAGDVEAVALKSGDFVYADPPYDVEFTSYSQGGFSWPDQERTARALSRHDGPVVRVNQATTRIEKLYRSLGYAIRFLEAPRRIALQRRPHPCQRDPGVPKSMTPRGASTGAVLEAMVLPARF